MMPPKYEPLSQALRVLTGRSVEFRFVELDSLVGGLPSSARSQRTWWANTVNRSHVHAAAWINVGWIVDKVDVGAEWVSFTKGAPPTRSESTASTPDGVRQLADVLRRAGYPTTMHAVAAHTVFLHPDTVAQTHLKAVFPTVRRQALANERVGSYGTVNGRDVMFDDNLSPTSAFLWASGQRRGLDMQFNHVWQSSRDPDSYTALWNVCATPAFLAKTTDGRNHPEVTQALQYRAWEQYGVSPSWAPTPSPPDQYAELEWALRPPPVADLEAVYRKSMLSKPKDRVVMAARQLGWLYSGWQPDDAIRPARSDET